MKLYGGFVIDLEPCGCDKAQPQAQTQTGECQGHVIYDHVKSSSEVGSELFPNFASLPSFYCVIC
jgi:hypothetical protein